MVNSFKGGTSFPVTYPPETQRMTKTRNPSSSQSSLSLSSLGSTPADRSAFPLSSTTSKYSYSDGNFDSWCEETVYRNIKWPKAWPGQTVTLDCPNNQAG